MRQAGNICVRIGRWDIGLVRGNGAWKAKHPKGLGCMAGVDARVWENVSKMPAGG